MWTPATRRRQSRAKLRHESELTDAEWTILAPFLPALARCGRRRAYAMREIVNAISYVLRGGIAWLNRCRRLAKDWENRSYNALAFLRLASIRLMLRKLCNPA